MEIANNLKPVAYLMTCKTDLHAGSGDSTFGVIDNLVQRDSITEMPTVNASSLKGALREYFSYYWKQQEEKDYQKKLNYIFGVDNQRKTDATEKFDSEIGHYKFFPADLLVLPVRSSYGVAYYHGTCPFLKEEIERKADFFGTTINFPTYPAQEGKSPKIKSQQPVLLEDFKAITDSNGLDQNDILGDNIAWFNDQQFKQIAEQLPVIARNSLENGISKNLWYEEVVPRETRFVFFVLQDGDYRKDFEDLLLDEKPIQVGANSSIGRGYISIKKISQ